MSVDLRLRVEAARGSRAFEFSATDHRVNLPQKFWTEDEPDGTGGVVQVLTILLTASECPWRCAMCDLWQHTLPFPTPRSAIPRQIEHALEHSVDSAKWIKLYNSGSFFDAHSIPKADYAAIASLCTGFERVIVENHPRLSDARVAPFRELLDAQFEIAMGVETLQPGMLRRLNKGMNRDDIDRAVKYHNQFNIDTRCFILVRPPWTGATEAVKWAVLTLRHLFSIGVRHASLIPVRSGNGWMDQLQASGAFQPPSVDTIESTLDQAFQITKRGVVTMDLWDWPTSQNDISSVCSVCLHDRRNRLEQMNLTQTLLPSIHCESCGASSTI